MCNELKTFIQTAVRFDVQIFGILVCNIKQFLCVAVHRTAVVDFKLYAEMTQTFAVEHEVWRVAVLVNNLAVFVPAGHAVSIVVSVPVRAVAMNNPAAVIAADVILIKAMIAECVGIVLDGVFLVDPLGTVVADYSQTVGAVLAEPVAFYLKHIFNRVLGAAVCTNSCFLHWLFLHFVW